MKSRSIPALAGKDGRRLLKDLAAQTARLVRGDDAGATSGWILRTGSGSRRPVDPELVSGALSAGLVEASGAEGLRISSAGRMALRRLLSGADPFQAQHRDVEHRTNFEVGPDGAVASARTLRINRRESSLAWLSSRRDRTGKPLLDQAQFRAGERLREDYSFAAMMPSTGQGWRTERVDNGRGGSRDGLTDATLNARRRVERVLGSLDPTLAGVLVDVCCHLKGLEVVETERGWPPRSAKIVLQIALSSLADLYGESRSRPGPHPPG